MKHSTGLFYFDHVNFQQTVWAHWKNVPLPIQFWRKEIQKLIYSHNSLQFQAEITLGEVKWQQFTIQSFRLPNNKDLFLHSSLHNIMLLAQKTFLP